MNEDWDFRRLADRRRVPLAEVQMTWPYDPDPFKTAEAWPDGDRYIEASRASANVALTVFEQAVKADPWVPCHDKKDKGIPLPPILSPLTDRATLDTITCWIADQPDPIEAVREEAGLIRSGQYRDPRPAPFVLKVDPLKVDTVLNEIIVGRHALNALRTELPNFMYVFGGFNDPKEGWASLLELLNPVESLYTFCRSIKQAGKNRVRIHAAQRHLDLIALQLVLALAVAQERFDFAHNDLHTDNVLIQRLDEPVVLTYAFQDGTRVHLGTDLIAVLIDFGRSFVSIPAPTGLASPTQTQIELGLRNKDGTTLHTGSAHAEIGLDYHTGNSLFDVCRLIGCMAAEVSTASLGAHVFEWLRPLFRTPEDYMLYFNGRRKWQGHKAGNSCPLTKSIAYRDVVWARLFDVSKGDNRSPFSLRVGVLEDEPTEVRVVSPP